MSTLNEIKTKFATDKNIKDIKFSLAGFSSIMIILLHYTWIMRQWIRNPELPNSILGMYFAIFFAASGAVLTVLAKVVYVNIYREEIEAEAKEEALKNAKKSQ